MKGIHGNIPLKGYDWTNKMFKKVVAIIFLWNYGIFIIYRWSERNGYYVIYNGYPLKCVSSKWFEIWVNLYCIQEVMFRLWIILDLQFIRKIKLHVYPSLGFLPWSVGRAKITFSTSFESLHKGNEHAQRTLFTILLFNTRVNLASKVINKLYT